uniref:EF-hand domain-containing family member C2 n=1 Tax=Rhinolophus ferrumequinum TaxID=59479 RepID=A0A671FYU8_RHIFE
MALPLLPGYSFSRNVGKTKFHKSQHWGFCNNVSMLVGESKPGIGGEPLLGQKMKHKYSVFTKEVGSDAPAWVAFDKQVLSFDAYVEDKVRDTSQENYGIRYYKILFYLEDDTIQVNEPEVRNSGMPQGTFIRRHRISLPPPEDAQFYTVHHFNVNIDIVFYGRTFKIYDCDAFTKNFLKKIGVKLNPPGQCPEDPSMKIWRKKLDCVKRLQPQESSDTLKQFLQYDRKVLRFFCLWDDSASLFGDRRELVLHYFLSDDTIEIIELLAHNSGRDALPFFLQRRKLPKYVNGYVLDKYKLGKSEQEFYKDSDLSLGTTINVWGRKVVLCDCDEFTKTYYKNKYGIENFTPISFKAPLLPKIERKFPPYTGFGSEEDSLCSCIGLVPKPCLHLRNVGKFMEKDSYGNTSGILRFLAKLITKPCANEGRLFIISYFLSDDTISVFEPTERNSVFNFRKFLKRMRVEKPGQEVFKSELSEYIKAEDLYIGAKVNVNGHLFVVFSADEYTLKFMEENSDKFPLSNLELVLEKLKEKISKSGDVRQVFRAADSGLTKKMDCNTFRDIVMTIAAGNLTEQEFVTIARHYRVPDDPCPDVNVLIAMAHEQLKKNSFENFERLICSSVYQDRERKKVLPSKDIKRLCKSFRLPLSNDLLESLLSKFENSDEQINYESFFCALNWRINIMPTQIAKSPLKERDDVLVGMPSPISMKYIDYLKFLKDIYGLEEE